MTLTLFDLDCHGQIIEICLNCHNYLFIILGQNNTYDKNDMLNYYDMTLTFYIYCQGQIIKIC
jgi:hypothetical protein